MGALRTRWEVASYFAFIDVHFLLRQARISLNTHPLNCCFFLVGWLGIKIPISYRASDPVHDSLPFQSFSAGQGQRHRAGRLPGREAGLPSRPRAVNGTQEEKTQSTQVPMQSHLQSHTDKRKHRQ